MSRTADVLTDQSPALAAAPTDALPALVYHVSSLAHSDVPVSELVERVGSLILYSLHADATSITLQDVQAGSPATYSDQRLSRDERAEAFLFSRPIVVRGVTYGQLEISVSTSKWPVATLLDVAETLADMLGRRAEREELRAGLSALREQAENLRYRRHLDVLLARAAGAVASERRWPADKAEQWIRQEAVRQGYPLLRFAERLILAQTLHRRFTPVRPGLPLRRTA